MMGALRVLKNSARRELLALVTPLDETYESRTLPDPRAPADLPWWRRRC
jgi:hypothetical protein